MSTPNTHFGPSAICSMLSDCRAIYFIGIGGISMSSLAVLTLKKGWRVGGFDRTPTAVTERLAAAGIPVDTEASSRNLDGYDAVVYTVAIPESQPEYAEARRRGLPLISRADYMGYLMMDYRMRIGVAGTHGKSTTTCMCARIFMGAGMDPTVLAGASMKEMGGAFRAGGQEHLIFEACEYMDSFLDFRPTVAVLLNAEMDHVDYFHSMEQLRASFRAYASLVGREGCVIANGDDAELSAALRDMSGPTLITFGCQDPKADYRAENIRLIGGYPSFTVWERERRLFAVTLSVPGLHNVYNALAAVAVARQAGLCSRTIAAGLEQFGGAGRRMERKGKLCGATVYDDYGHHPTEVRTTLAGARALDGNRLICLFQPHTYSRTAALFGDYVSALRLADQALILPVYAARETDTLGISAEILASAIGENARACASLEEAAGLLPKLVRDGDTVVIMGAGNVDRIYPLLPLRPFGENDGVKGQNHGKEQS